MRKVYILYEDQRGPKTGFGLHELVVACVHAELDDAELLRHRINRVLVCLPMKGVEKLLKKCREEIELIAPDGGSVIAVIDDDKVRKPLALPPNASEERVVQAIRKSSTAPEQLFIILLKRNTESVIEALRDCDPDADEQLIARALKKELNARDILLTRASKNRSVRDCLLEQVPSLRSLVELLGDQLQPARKGAKARPSRKPSSSRRAWLTRSATRSPRSRPRA